jgi:hypothetical protein
MKIGNVLRFLFSVGATILVLSMNWMATPSRLSTKGLGSKLNGIRLVAPLGSCDSTTCRSQQTGCGKLSLVVCIPTCEVPAMSFAEVRKGTAPYTFTVTDPNGNHVSTSLPTAGSSGVFVTFTAMEVGFYTVTVTDANGCRISCSDEAHLEVAVEAPPCQIPGTFTAFVDGGTAPYSFTATDPSGNPVSTSTPTPSNFGSFLATFTGTKTGQYTVTVTDAKGCQGTAKAAVTSCSSLTQSEWGKNKPKFNGKKRGKSLRTLFASSFSRSPNPSDLTVGVPRLGLRSVTFLDDAATCIIDRLPATGTPASLPVGLGDARVNSDTCQTSPQLPLVDGKFQNELLGQTIALTLNAGGTFDAGGLSFDFFGSGPGLETLGLWNMVICNAMVTQSALPGSDGVLGTVDDLLDPGADGVIGTQDDPKFATTIPTPVLNAIASGSALELLGRFTLRVANSEVTVRAGSVGRLLILANLALAGETNLGGASLVDINRAVDAINGAFDRGRFLISCACPSCAHLQINFSPNPVPQDTRCGGPFPSWVIGATLNETGGVGVTITRFTTDLYDSNGDLFSSNPLNGDGFASFFTNCGPRSNHIAANGRACALICQSVVALPSRSGSLIMRLEGTDDNGQPVSITSDRLVLLGSGSSPN